MNNCVANNTITYKQQRECLAEKHICFKCHKHFKGLGFTLKNQPDGPVYCAECYKKEVNL